MSTGGNRPGRFVHLVGSIPAEDAEQAMLEAAKLLGPRLRTLPDGETGERSRWIVHIVQSFRDHPDLELHRDGDYSDYERKPEFRVRRGHKLRGDSLDFGHVAVYDANAPIFQRIKQETGLSDLTFQAGVPGDLDMALFTLGPLGALRHRRAFTDATVKEIHEIHQRGKSSVLFQIELPAELVMVAQTPGPLRPAVAALLAKGIARLAQRAPAGARFGIHLCLGDLGNRALGTLRDASPVVALANAIVKRWPAHQPLEFLHAPFAAGNQPAPMDPNFYRALSGLRLPADTRFIAGIVHENRDLAEHRQILNIIEQNLDRQVDVAAACGLGRRTPQVARHTMDLAARLV